MGTDKIKAKIKTRVEAKVGGSMKMEKRRRFILLSLLLSLALVSCSGESIGPTNPVRSVRPVVKIGLIAPFEGIYRRSGYESLAAMRSALTDHAALTQAAGIDILPLALDDSGDPQMAARTAQKLLADPAVEALIGPISPWTAQAVTDTIHSSSLQWERPYLADQPEEEWAIDLIRAISQAAQQQGAERLLVAGWVDGWPAEEMSLWREKSGLPIEFIDSKDEPVGKQIRATDAILFLGAAADAATFLSIVRQEQESVPFWMGPQGGNPILFERATRVNNVYWAIALDGGYDEWRKTHEPATPAAYLVYKATERTILSMTNPAQVQDKLAPEIRLFSVEPNGISIDYMP